MRYEGVLISIELHHTWKNVYAHNLFPSTKFHLPTINHNYNFENKKIRETAETFSYIVLARGAWDYAQYKNVRRTRPSRIFEQGHMQRELLRCVNLQSGFYWNIADKILPNWTKFVTFFYWPWFHQFQQKITVIDTYKYNISLNSSVEFFNKN